MRYIFIVHDERVAKFGKQRAEHLFYWLLGIVPIVMTIWLYFGADDRDYDGYPALNRCNGSYDKIFLLKWGFSEHQSVWDARCERQKLNTGPFSAIELLEFTQCRASLFMFMLLMSNLFESFIYYRTWTHIIKK